jgi:hypothetical protein
MAFEAALALRASAGRRLSSLWPRWHSVGAAMNDVMSRASFAVTPRYNALRRHA